MSIYRFFFSNRSRARWFAPGLLAATCLGAALAEPTPQRVGVSGAPVSLSLRDAVLFALDHNPGIQVSRAQVEEAKMNLLAGRGAYDPHVTGSLNLLSDTVQVASILAGGDSGVVASDSLEGTVSIGQYLPFGGSWSVLFNSRRTTTSNVFTQLDPQFPSRLTLTVEFPLWRNLAIDSRRLEIKVASKAIERSEAELRRNVLDTVTAVRDAYWDLYKARETASVNKEAVELAESQLTRNRRLLEAGQVAEVEVIEAEAELQRRRGDFLAAVEEITRTENAIKQLILGDRSADLWNRELTLSDPIEVGPQDIDLAQAFNTALQFRPELESLRKSEEAQRLNSDYLVNQTKPNLDLVGSYGISGLAGSERVGGNPFSSQNSDLRDRVNELSEIQGLPPLPPPATGALPDILLGGFGQSLSNLFSNDYRTAQIGLRLDLPLFNREAEGRLGVSRARERQLAASRGALEQRIEAELRDSLQAVATARQRQEAAQSARMASQAKLESENRLFDAGETTNFLVLTRQEEYVSNKAREVQAKADLNKAVNQLQRALGTTLEVFQIQLQP